MTLVMRPTLPSTCRRCFCSGARIALIPVERSASVIRDILTQSGHGDFTIQVLDNDDHGMHDVSGSVDPRYLDAMRRWLAGRVRISLNGRL